ncbi:MAG: enoyl-CoA hydratase/isomerase family protein [Bauldia sp.]|uniref:enoyl-CoA hydratase n=1 Tax=Bauldia sp. TaxID=2575872 RepID=UPI001E128C13|nr:enoyl-CoA hydratase [Bauldia sp.]MCB1495442.1 enoyl-CoA hydratase/isomerase family protein [Bauldia sp.]
MSDGSVRLDVTGGVATVVFDRPSARNAMTMAMYGELGEACDAIAGDSSVRVAVFRGAGESFVAGTDIAHFTSFTSAEDGIAYEQAIDATVDRLERLPVPTVAAITGAAVGGGLVLAAACDIRVATPGARFGIPIARTVGNCVSIANAARLAAAFGVSRAKRLLLLAELLSAEEARSCGFLTEIVDGDAMDGRVAAICDTISAHAPITMRAAREALRRVVVEGLPDDGDLIRAAYGSEDFRRGVSAFLEKARPRFEGS